MQFSEPIALAVVRARGRAIDVLVELANLAQHCNARDSAETCQDMIGRLCNLGICVEADRVVARIAVDEKLVDSVVSPNQPLP